MARCSRTGPLLVPLQPGVEVSEGAQSLAIGHAARAALGAWDGVVLLQLDCKNAFNSLWGAAIIQAVPTRLTPPRPLRKTALQVPSGRQPPH